MRHLPLSRCRRARRRHDLSRVAGLTLVVDHESDGIRCARDVSFTMALKLRSTSAMWARWSARSSDSRGRVRSW